MSEPWGISGPAFIELYLTLLALPLVLLAGAYLLASRRSGAAKSVGDPPELYELAYLAGGPDRATDTVIAALVERKALRVSTKKVHKVGVEPSHPLERAVVDAARRGAHTGAIRKRVRGSAEMKELTRRLERRGLIVRGDVQAWARRAAAVLYLAIFVLGIVRWVNGHALGRPIGALTFLLILAFAATAISGRMTKRRSQRSPTPAGRSALLRARTRYNRHLRASEKSTLPAGFALTGAAGAVALGGLVMYPDEEISTALRAPVGTTIAGAAAAGGWSSSGGSSGSSWWWTTGGSSGGSGGGSSCSTGSSCGGGGSSCGGGGGGGCGG